MSNIPQSVKDKAFEYWIQGKTGTAIAKELMDKGYWPVVTRSMVSKWIYNAKNDGADTDPHKLRPTIKTTPDHWKRNKTKQEVVVVVPSKPKISLAPVPPPRS